MNKGNEHNHFVNFRNTDEFYLPLTRIVSKQSNKGCRRWCPVVIILWKTTTNKSAWVPNKADDQNNSIYYITFIN